MTKQSTILWRALAGLVIIAMLVAFVPLGMTTARAATAGPGNGGFNYAEALQKAILFYEQQRSGRLSTSTIPTRISWRGDSQLQDGQDVGLDLTGGWVDAGDNVKFAFPMSEAVSVLAWGAVEYPSAYTGSGQMVWLKNQLRWANDWFIKAHPSANVFYGQVGNGGSDHSYWAAVETTNLTTLSGPTAAGQPTNRPSYAITAACGGGADLAGGVAAAMAASSIVFRNSGDTAYADTLLGHAAQLDTFAHNYQQEYTKCITDAQGYYRSFSSYKDELVWSDIWLAKANDAKNAGSGAAYWAKAQAEYPAMPKVTGSSTPEYAFTLNWDDKSFGAYILMAQQFPNNVSYNYNTDAERYLNYWLPNGGGAGKYTPGGHIRIDVWGSFRYASNLALTAFIYADHISDTAKQTAYRNMAEQQINYILGQNPRGCSYEMGFGSCPPLNPHHRTASGGWLGYLSSPPVPATARHIMYGALSGSVDATDGFKDDMGEFQSTEPAVDYNSAFVGALAKMYSLFGGTPIADSNFPPPDNAHSCKDEYAAFALSYSSQANGYQTDIYLENRSAWPATVRNNYAYRYYFTLDSANISDLTITPANTSTLSAPTLYDATNKVYYVTGSFANTPVYPGGNHMVHGGFTISTSGAWSAANDWSWGGPGATTPWNTSYMGGNNDHGYAANIEVYDGTTKLCGNAPGTSATVVPTLTASATRTATRTNSPTPTGTMTPGGPTLTPTRTPTRTNSPTPTRTPTRTNTPGTGTCSPVTATIAAPFSQNGTGTFCWQSSNLGTFINNWNMASLTINGVSFSNVWAATSSLPAKIGGFWYVIYTSTNPSSHFEAQP